MTLSLTIHVIASDETETEEVLEALQIASNLSAVLEVTYDSVAPGGDMG